MYKTTFIFIKILVDVLQQITIVQAIIVERNLYAYYRLPTTTIKTSNATEDYFILQCPFKANLDIPPAKDMSVCMIVGRFNENLAKEMEFQNVKLPSNLHTQVDYKPLKAPTKIVKLVKLKNSKPYAMKLVSVKGKEMYKRPKTTIKEHYKSTNLRLFQNNPKVAVNKSTTVLYPPPLPRIQVNDSIAYSSTNTPQKLIAPPPPMDKHNLSLDFVDDPMDDDDVQTPLKYLGVKDTLTKLKLQHKPSVNSTFNNSEKLFAELNKYKKGFRTKGYQNMYHRDEIYQDHIFYDDLQQMGNYHLNKKLKAK